MFCAAICAHINGGLLRSCDESFSFEKALRFQCLGLFPE